MRSTFLSRRTRHRRQQTASYLQKELFRCFVYRRGMHSSPRRRATERHGVLTVPAGLKLSSDGGRNRYFEHGAESHDEKSVPP